MADGSVPIVLSPEPFARSATYAEAPAGCTVRTAITEAVRAGSLSLDDLKRTSVYIDGERLDRDKALDHVLAEGQIVNVVVEPLGGGGGGSKDIGQVLLTIAVIAVSAWVGGGGLGLTSAFWTKVAAASVMVAGQAAIAALYAPESASQARANDRYALQSASNQFRQWGPMPLALGEVVAAPDLVAKTFTQNVGDESWIYGILGLHYGPCTVEELKIGDTLVSSMGSADVRIAQHLTPGPRTFSIVPNDIDQLDLQEELTATTGSATPVVRAASAEGEKFEFDFYLPMGLYYAKDDGRKAAAQVTATVRYRPVDANGNPTGSGSWSSGLTVPLNAATNEPMRVMRSLSLPLGRYQFEVRRSVRQDNNAKRKDDIYWTAVRAVAFRKPVADETLSIIEFAVRATALNQGTLAPITCRITPVCPTWTGAQWGPAVPTSNPAALVRWLMTGPAPALPLTALQADQGLRAWAALCDQYNWESHIYLTDDRKQDVVLGMLGRAGRAGIFWDGTQLVAAPWVEKPAPRQLFAGGNLKDHRWTNVYPDEVHALRVEFLNIDQAGEPDELYVYADGYAETAGDGKQAATLVEALRIDGQMTLERAYREGRWTLGQRIHQRRIDTWSTDIEHVVSRFGDRVRLAWDRVNGTDCRVRCRRWSGSLVSGLRLAHPVTMEPGQTYAMDMRLGDQLVAAVPVVNPATTGPVVTREVAFASPRAANVSPVGGDLVAFGTTERLSEDVEIIGIEPGQNLTANITAIRYVAPLLMQGETGPIPPLQSKLTGDRRKDPPTPTLLGVSIDEAGARVGFSMPPWKGSPITGFGARWRAAPSSSDLTAWVDLPDLPAGAMILATPPLRDLPAEDNVTRVQVEIRAMTASGRASDPLTVTASMPVVEVPSADVWTVTIRPPDASGAQLPGLIVTGTSIPERVAMVAIGWGLSEEGPWKEAYSGPPVPKGVPLDSLPPGADVWVSIAYFSSQGVPSGFLVLGPFPVPNLIADDALNLGGFPASDLLTNLASAQAIGEANAAAVDELFDVYGHTASAAAEAAEAAEAAAAAILARADAVIAKGDAQGAASSALADALEAAEQAGVASERALAAVGAASLAEDKADEAGVLASAASAASVMATTARDGVVDLFIRQFPPVLDVTGRQAYEDYGPVIGPDAGWPTPYISEEAAGSFTIREFRFRRMMPKVVGRRYRIEVWVYSYATNVAFSITRHDFADEAGAGIRNRGLLDPCEVGVVSVVPTTAGFVLIAGEFTVPADDQAFTRPYLAASASGGANNGLVHVGGIRITDVTEQTEAKVHATAASTFASSAAVSEDAAGQSASAATQAKNEAETARGQAETYRNEAADSVTTAAGAASTAVEQAGLAASARNAAEDHAGAALTSRNQASGFADDAETAASVSTSQKLLAEAAREGAQDQAQAASEFASTASAAASDAGIQASASQTARQAAETARGQAETYRNETAAARDDAEGHAATAATQAGLSAISAGIAGDAQEDAQNAAEASIDAAGVATTKAGEASSSAAASEVSRVQASSAFDATAQLLYQQFPPTLAPGDRGSYTGYGPIIGPSSDWPTPYISDEAAGTINTVREFRHHKPIAKVVGRRYRVEAWVFSYATNVRFSARRHDYPNAEGVTGIRFRGQLEAAEAGSPDLKPAPQTWALIAGEFTVPAEDQAFTRPYIEAATDNGAPSDGQVHVGGIKITDVTEAKTAREAAEAAVISASDAATFSSAAEDWAEASEEQAVLASGSAGDALTYRDQAATARDGAVIASASSSLSATASDTARDLSEKARDKAFEHRDAASNSAGIAEDKAAEADAFAASASISASLAASTSALRGNLLPNGGMERGLEGISGQNLYVVSDSWGPAVRVAPTGSGTYTIDWAPVGIAGGETYTVSGDAVLLADAGSRYFDMIFLDSGGNVVGDSGQKPMGPGDYSNDMARINAMAFAAQAPGNATQVIVRAVFEGAVNPTAMGARRVKLEFGNLPATAYTADAAVDALSSQLNITAATTADLATRMATARFEVIAAAGGDPAQLVIRADTSGSVARLVASAISFANVVNGTIVEAMKLIGGEVFFMRPIYIDVGQSRLIVGPGNGWVLWFGGNDKNAAAATRTNGIFCLGTDSKIYHGSAELGSGVTAKAAQLTFSGSIGRSAPLTTLGTTEAMNVPSTGKFVLDVSAFAESARNGSVTTAQGTLFVFIVKDGVESLLAEAPASTDAPSPGAAVNTRALNMTVQHAHAGAVAFRVKAQGGGSTTWSIGLIDGVLKSTYFPT